MRHIKYILNYKYVNKVNLLLIFLCSALILFLTIDSIKKSSNFKGVIKKIEITSKKDTQTKLMLENNKTITYNFRQIIFNQNQYLDFKIGDKISYSLSNDNVTYLKNFRNNSELGFFYFIINLNFSYLLILAIILFYYNVTQFMYFNSLLKDMNFKVIKDKTNILDRINEYLKGKKFLTFIAMIFLFIIFYLSINFLKHFQYILQNLSLYKYIFIFYIFFFSIPIIYKNYYYLKKINR